MAEHLDESVRFHALEATSVSEATDPAVSRGRINEAAFDNRTFSTQILELLDRHGSALANRETLPGHLTGSALVVDSSGEHVLLLLHAKLGRWLQPGGHADGDHELAGVALREATEETGITGLKVLVPAIDIDVHEIPARGDDPAHLHLDVRFLVIAPKGAQVVGNDESHALRWIKPESVSTLTDEVSLNRLIVRGLAAYRHYLSQA